MEESLKAEYTKAIEALDDVVRVYGIYRNEHRHWYVSLKTVSRDQTTMGLTGLLGKAGVPPPEKYIIYKDQVCLFCPVIFTPQMRNQKYCSAACQQEAKKKNGGKRRRFSTYGITELEYNRMLEEQDGKCYICKAVPTRMVIDHCHTTGRVRHLLCVRCNSCLGWLETYKTEAEKYLERVAA